MDSACNPLISKAATGAVVSGKFHGSWSHSLGVRGSELGATPHETATPRSDSTNQGLKPPPIRRTLACSLTVPILSRRRQSCSKRTILRRTPLPLSAAQPQPKDRGEIDAFVPNWALCRAALKRATSSPNGEMRAGSVAEKFEAKSLEARADLQFRRRLSNIILGSKGRTLVTIW